MKRLSKSLGFDMKGIPLDSSFEQWVKLFNYYTENIIEAKKLLIWGSAV